MSSPPLTKTRREADLDGARELIPLLDPIDPHRLGLYAVLRILEERAMQEDQWCTASIVVRDMSDSEHSVHQGKSVQAFALMANGKLLGHMGEEGWKPICDQVANDHGMDRYFVSGSFRVIQRAHGATSWREEEREEIDRSIISKIEGLRARLEASRLSAILPPARHSSCRRGL